VTDPALALTALVAATAAVPLLPGVLRAAGRLGWRWVATPTRSRPAVAAVLVAALARPAPAAAVTPPPLLRMPLPSDGSTVTDPAAASGRATVPAAVPRRYVVVAGDSLWAITARHLRAAAGSEPSLAEVDRGWRRLYERNRSVVGADPDLIFPGQQLIIPEEW
jgi:resuscitation-promoting factor RpfA